MFVNICKIPPIVCLLLLCTSFVHSAPLPPQAICKVTAKVLSIESQGMNFLMEIEILNFESMVKQRYHFDGTCGTYQTGKRFSVGTVKDRDFVHKEDNVIIDTILRGNIQYTGDEWGTGYFFTEVEIVHNWVSSKQ